MNRWLTRDKSYYQSLVTLAIPVALQNLVTFLVTFADNYMVTKLGDTAVSGVYMGSQVQTLIQMFTNGLSGAILIISAQYWGKRDTASIRRLVAIGLRASALVGLIFTGLVLSFSQPIMRFFSQDEAVIAEGMLYMRWVSVSYIFFCITQALISAMRSVEITFVGLLSSFISLLVNVALNYVLIFGKLGLPRMEVKGAAIATAAARFVETVVAGVYVLCKDDRLNFRLKSLLLRDKALLHDLLKYGAPLVAGDVVWSVNMMFNSKIMGGYGPETVSGLSVANSLNTLCYITISGLASAVGIISGKTIGAGKTELMKEYARTTQVLFLLLGFFNAGVLLLLRVPFVALHSGISPEAARQALSFTAVLCVTIFGTSYQMPCLFGLVKSGGDISFVFINDTIFVFLVVLPSAFLAAHFGAPAWVTFACLKCDQILKCFVAVVKINRFNWMKKLTRETA